MNIHVNPVSANTKDRTGSVFGSDLVCPSLPTEMIVEILKRDDFSSMEYILKCKEAKKNTKSEQIKALWQKAFKKALGVAKFVNKELELAPHYPYPLKIRPYYWKEIMHSNHLGIEYLNHEERKDYECTFQNGLIENAFCDSKDTSIFVISLDDKLYCNSDSKLGFHHSSFLAGGAVKMAGGLKRGSDNQIVEINDISGHYLPNIIHMVQGLKFFKEKGVDLSKVNVKAYGYPEKNCNAIVFLNNVENYLNKRSGPAPMVST